MHWQSWACLQLDPPLVAHLSPRRWHHLQSATLCKECGWQKSVSLGNPDMWRGGRLPCSNQTIILPENEVVFMPHTFSVGSDLVFPQNGMILLPSSGESFPLKSQPFVFHEILKKKWENRPMSTELWHSSWTGRAVSERPLSQRVRNCVGWKAFRHKMSDET